MKGKRQDGERCRRKDKISRCDAGTKEKTETVRKKQIKKRKAMKEVIKRGTSYGEQRGEKGTEDTDNNGKGK